jgi:general secretion pathway protein D
VPVRPAGPEAFPGSGQFVRSAQESPGSGRAVASPDGNVSFNFVNADVREVARELLGEQLRLNYVVDPKVQATITAQTGSPLPRSAVLPTLEGVLRASGLALVEMDGLYRVLPLEDAARASSPSLVSAGVSRPGYAIRVLPLKFIPVAELKAVLDPFVPPGGVLQADGTRNVLVVSGPAGDLDGFAELVRQFDTDWMRGTSFALYPLRVGVVKDIASELQAILQQGGEGTGQEAGQGTGPLAGVVRAVPIERLNAILVIASQPSYLQQVKVWIDRLDYGEDQTTPRLFEYYVQNSRAIDLAGVLTDLLSGEGRGTAPQTAPGGAITEMTTPIRAGGYGGLFGQGLGTTQSPAPPGQMPGAGLGTTGGLTGASQPIGALGQTQQAQGLRGAAGRPSQLAQQRPSGLGTAGTPGLELPPIRIVADEKNNALVIFARPRDFRMIEGIIRKLDIVPLQVLLEATIAEVTLNDSLRYGLQFFLKAGSSSFSLTNATTGTVSTRDITGVFPGFNYVLSGADTRVILSAISAITNVNVISSPQILVLDHQTAALQIGDQVPIIVQSAQSVVNPDSPIVNSVQYRNTGVILQVTPRVNTTGLVTLDIDQEVSDVSRTTSSNINSPTIAQRRIISSVVVQDGETVALGGLIKDNQTDIRSGIPILSEIPILGALFRTTTRATARTELLVLLAPRVIRSAKEARDVTEELRTRMRALSPIDVRIR